MAICSVNIAAFARDFLFRGNLSEDWKTGKMGQ